MLTRLIVRRFKLIDDAHLELCSSLNCFTGETGAGKSMLLSALRALKGENIPVSLLSDEVKPPYPELQIWFQCDKQSLAYQWLEEHQYQTEDDENVIRRVYKATKKNNDAGPVFTSALSINGIRCSLSEVRELTSLILEIETQGAFSRLSKSQERLKLLDQNFLSDTQSCSAAWKQRQESQERLTQAQTQVSESSERRQVLNWRNEQLEQLDPQENEFSEIDQQLKAMENIDAVRLAVSQTIESIESDQGVAMQLSAIQSKLPESTGSNDLINEAYELVESSINYLEDAKTVLRKKSNTLNLDEEQLEQLRGRHQIYLDISHRVGQSPESLLDYYQDTCEELANIEHDQSHLPQLEKDFEDKNNHFQTVSQALSKQRKLQATKIEEKLNPMLKQLSMSGRAFLQISQAPPSAFGCDQLDILYHPLGKDQVSAAVPIAKIASGGELSRIYLALLLTASHLPDCLVLDEVDTGIGGETATTVGGLLNDIAKQTQVLIVTHLPTIAAYSDQHYSVNKSASGHVSFAQLDEQAKRKELKRMLGGQSAHDKLKEAASEL